jgi:cytochrome c biogenesis protein CcmG/thiol:disulfide interchange protein DsbE
MTTSQTDEAPAQRRRVSPAWAAAGAVGLVVLLLLAYSLATGPSAPLQPGELAPSFKLNSLEGDQIDLDDQLGKVVVVNFFASWCDPCRQEAADLEQTWDQYQSEGVRFFGIAYKDASSKVQAFLDQFGVTYPCALDPGGRTARAYGLTGVPETFVINGQGQLHRHIVGPVDQDELGLVIDQVLGR